MGVELSSEVEDLTSWILGDEDLLNLIPKDKLIDEVHHCNLLPRLLIIEQVISSGE